MINPRTIKLVLVGDEAVGKTCLGLSYTQGYFLDDHVYTVFDHYSTCIQIDDTPVKLGVWDSAGQDAYDYCRPLSYIDTHVFLVCFSLVNPKSFERVTSKWCPEINHHRPNVPFLLVGTKLDLREKMNKIFYESEKLSSVIQYRQGLSLSKQIGAVRYMECSSRTLKGVTNVFEEAVRVTFETSVRLQRRPFCNVL